MNNKLRANFKVFWLPVLVFALLSCGENPVTGSHRNIPAEGIPADQIHWLSWSPEVLQSIENDGLPVALRKGTDSKWILRVEGGTVGGTKTFDNKVDIPVNAFDNNQEYITVDVINVQQNQQVAAGVDFLPDMQFDSNVTITLSFAFLDYQGSCHQLDFTVYWSRNNGNTWYPITDYSVNCGQKTITFTVDHFTRYAWGLS